MDSLDPHEPSNYAIHHGWLFFRNRLCVLQSFRAPILHDAHDALAGGRRGMNATLEKVERYFYWPKLRKDVFNYVAQCSICQKVKVPHGKQQGLLMPLPIPEGPFEDISMDFVTNLPPSPGAWNTQCLTIVDRFSKFCMLIPCKANVTAQDVARLFIRHWYPLCGES